MVCLACRLNLSCTPPPQTTSPISVKLLLCLIAQTSPAFYLGDVPQITFIIYMVGFWCCYQKRKDIMLWRSCLDAEEALACAQHPFISKHGRSFEDLEEEGFGRQPGRLPPEGQWVHPHQTFISIAETFLCHSALIATCREAVTCDGKVTMGITLGQFRSPAFLPGKSNFCLTVYKKNIKTLTWDLVEVKKGEGLSELIWSALVGKGLH